MSKFMLKSKNFDPDYDSKHKEKNSPLYTRKKLFFFFFNGRTSMKFMTDFGFEK